MFKLDYNQYSNDLTDEKNVNKRRSFFDENNERDGNFHYPDFGANRKDFFVDNETQNNYDDQQPEKFQWEPDRNRMPHNNLGMDGSLFASDKSPEPTFIGKKMKTNVRQDWEKTNEFVDIENPFRVKDDRPPKYQNNVFSDKVEVINNNDIKKGYNPQFNNNFNTQGNGENELVSSSRPIFGIPPPFPITYVTPEVSPVRKLNLGAPDLFGTNKAIIINLKTECPTSNPTKNHLIHKLLISRPPTSPHMFPLKRFLVSSSPSNIYYLQSK
ncbi:hypothetical protein Phum_PHUM422780 [Pediculus humanus corporis]|uniref:Uncharacterized protein n=1 Tax=Pediculus humanus subsp. corporis TaxID=121224 RepID=E0VSR7_PEDHC|nr:uncharacterized protein Phum_PHUM422780 [Pediculus humanus corporis]EEB16423.1 hypothetical protein Phum_PHUM422780 [Pediculus humanus corporis]